MNLGYKEKNYLTIILPTYLMVNLLHVKKEKCPPWLSADKTR